MPEACLIGRTGVVAIEEFQEDGRTVITVMYMTGKVEITPGSGAHPLDELIIANIHRASLSRGLLR